jgi:hypothetical protein
MDVALLVALSSLLVAWAGLLHLRERAWGWAAAVIRWGEITMGVVMLALAAVAFAAAA